MSWWMRGTVIVVCDTVLDLWANHRTTVPARVWIDRLRKGWR